MLPTPLVAQDWARALEDHPDIAFRDYRHVLRGITEGFHIGFDYKNHTCRQASLAQGRVTGPIYHRIAPPTTQISTFRVIFKSNQPGKLKLIVDPSSPEGVSVNDRIDPELCSLQYLQLDTVIQQVNRLGCRTLLAKIDIERAYQIIPVHPEDRPLLGMCWNGELSTICACLLA